MRILSLILTACLITQTSGAQAAAECSEGGFDSLLKSKGFDRSSAEGKTTANFDLDAYSRARSIAKQKAESSPQMQEINKTINENLSLSDLEKSVDEYIAQVTLTNDLAVQIDKALPQQDNGYKKSPNLSTLQKQLESEKRKLRGLKESVEKKFFRIEEVYVRCPYAEELFVGHRIHWKLRSAARIINFNRPYESKYENGGRNSVRCDEIYSLNQSRQELIKSFVATEKQQLGKSLLETKHGKHLIKYFETYPGEAVSGPGTIETITNAKGETATIFLSNGKAHSAMIAREGTKKNTIELQRLAIDTADCKMSYSKFEVFEKGRTYIDQVGPTVSEASCAVVNRYKSDPFAWTVVEPKDKWKTMAECTQQGGRYFGSKYKTDCRCPDSDKTINPAKETCLKERFIDTSERFASELAASSKFASTSILDSTKERVIATCEENFAHVMGTKAPAKQEKAGLR